MPAATFLRKTMIKARVRGPSLFDVYGLCISNSTSAATQRCLIPNLFHFRHSRYPSVFLVCAYTRQIEVLQTYRQTAMAGIQYKHILDR